MPSKILTTSHRVANALNFRSSLDRISPDPTRLYLFFGREQEWDDEQAPPDPLNSITDTFATRDAVIGLKKITSTNLSLVVPRYNWISGTVYTEYSAADDDLFSKPFYVITSNRQVYKCLDNNNGANSVVEPTGTSTFATQTGDGYLWKFMYDLSSSMIETFLVNDWLPVPVAGQKTTFQLAVESNSLYSAGDPPGGHGSNAAEELGAYKLMIAQILSGTESGTFVVDDAYRQFGIWKDPLLVNNTVATATLYTVNDSNSVINETTGVLLYVENRRIITRASDQAENFQLILSF